MSDGLSDDDKDLLRKYMQGVRPLKGKGFDKPILKIRRAPVKIDTFDFVLSNFCIEEVQTDTILAYCQSNYAKQLKLLAKGSIPFEDTLDLHGETIASAETLFLKFFIAAIKDRLKCILVIHGKSSYHGKPPVLKNHVNHWLKQLPHVAAFHSALKKDGGTGAVYVLLKPEQGEPSYE